MEIRFGRHRFEPRSGRLWQGRREIRVTPRAAAVLAALIKRAGQPVTRDELFRTVWQDAVVSDGALTACIQELRNALDDDARRPCFIETRHRRGYRFIARLALSADVRDAESALPPLEAPPAAPIVGREREVDELRAELARAVRADRGSVFVTGELGIGKTTTVQAFLADATGNEPLRIAQGRCMELHGPGEPYLPLLEAMTRLCRDPDGHRIARLFRKHAPTWLAEMPSVGGGAEQAALRRVTSTVTRERMLRELADVVEVIGEDLPLVLWLEDLHWSDPSTVDWLSYVARRSGPARLLVLASYRPAAGANAALEAIKDELIVHGHAREVALGPLDERAVRDYLARRLPNAVALAPMLHRRTGGNPLFLVSVVDDLARRETAMEQPDLLPFEIPEDVRRVIGHALDRVDPRLRHVLEAASAAGVEFSAAVVAAAIGLPLDDVEQVCAELVHGEHRRAQAGT